MLAPNEAARLLALTELNVLDTPADPVLDGLVRSAALTLGCPIALVSLVDEHRQWFKARTGLEATQTPRDVAFCAHAILGEQLFVVPDAALDPRFADNPLVTGEPHVRFYAGVPLTVGGHNVGTLCVVDREPRELDATQHALLVDLARAVEHWLMSWHKQQQLQQTQGFLASIVRFVPGMSYQYLLAADGTSRFPYASEGLVALYELTPEAACEDARAVFDRLHPDDLSEVLASIERSAHTLMPWCQQYRVVLPQRGLRWLECQATPKRHNDGSVLWSGFIQDITDRMVAEQVVRENFASERASQAKSEFLSRVSHELRTPLNAVLGFSRLMQADASLNKRTRSHLDQILSGGQLLLELVTDLLDLTCIEHGLQALCSDPVEVMDVLKASLALIEPLASQRGIHFVQMPGNEAAVAQADARALGQVLLNLLSNAVKYNREQGALRVEVRSQGAEVAICVADEGMGLTADQRSNLFQPFNRLGAETGRMPGSGLGLVISKQLVEAMQGRLEVHEEIGGGCRFEVWLPAAATLHQAGPAVAPSPAVCQPAFAANRGAPLPLILCVEDNPVNALLLKAVIDDLGGCRLLFADDGEQAMNLAVLHKPTLMLSDINMPKMDGLALVQSIRVDPSLRAMRCIAMSGDAMADSRERALAAGFDAYWIKPLDLTLLEDEIRAHADRFQRQQLVNTG